MTTTYTALTELKVTWDGEKTDSLATRKDFASLKLTETYGTDDAETRRVYSAQRTVTAASGTDDIDLTALEDGFGDAISFTTVYQVYVQNVDTDSGDDLLVGGAGAANDAWNAPFNGDDDAQVLLGPEGKWFIDNPADGWAVEAGSKVLRVEHSGGTGGSRTYNIVIVGTSS